MIIIGGGRIGSALKARSDEAGIDCELVTRQDGWNALDGPIGTPVVLAVRNDDLVTVIDKVPENRHSDLVFIQNGMFHGLLRQRHLHRNTRGLLYFAVRGRSAPIEIGLNNPFCGPHAFVMTRWFSMMKLPVEEVDWGRFSLYEVEKLIWLCAFGLMCELHDADVGTICDTKLPELSQVVEEMRVVCRKATAVDIPLDWLMERLVSYSRTIPDYKAGVKEWKWRAGWLDAQARRYNYPMVLNREMLSAIGKGDLLA